ncbi:hypothetical protein Vafri_17057 [Volvox africanus]|uniref:Uncharacterized protein n=1 Tax=Volvox africanus TaxID=51714 RepID=A0A8J4BPV0_9CHLO|nr:hypothetical protein Vafri_17057 [Volvox africanus]
MAATVVAVTARAAAAAAEKGDDQREDEENGTRKGGIKVTGEQEGNPEMQHDMSSSSSSSSRGVLSSEVMRCDVMIVRVVRVRLSLPLKKGGRRVTRVPVLMLNKRGLPPPSLGGNEVFVS